MSRTTTTTTTDWRGQARRERDACDRLRAELIPAFAAPDSSYVALTAAEVIARNRT